MHTQPNKALNILGTRGIPACHGGFETFAERLALYLAGRGWRVTVYCQAEGADTAFEDDWHGIRRVHLGSRFGGPLGTMDYDLKCVRHVLQQPGVDLVLGYNTALFNLVQRLAGRRVLMNMDGIEWKRAKWGAAAKTWFWLNEIAGANICHVAIADHPFIARHVATRCFKTPVMIPYGAEPVAAADTTPLRNLGLEPDRYLVSIARIEPENSILEMVRGFSRLTTGLRCLVLGALDGANAYHRAVAAAAGPAVLFGGAVYDSGTVSALRFHARAYLHGHQVGGTNPSLVEALGAGNAVIAHDNRFNRWTAGPEQVYFASEAEFCARAAEVAQNPAWLARARTAARARLDQAFQWETVLAAYEALFEQQLVRGTAAGRRAAPRPAAPESAAPPVPLLQEHSLHASAVPPEPVRRRLPR